MRTIGIGIIGFIVGIFVSETLFGRGDSGLSPVSIVIALVCGVAAAIVEWRSSTTR